MEREGKRGRENPGETIAPFFNSPSLVPAPTASSPAVASEDDPQTMVDISQCDN